MLLAAGLGTRLRPLTQTIPKCLVPIKGKPLLKFWLENLSRAGISEIFINTHYKADQVVDFIRFSEYVDQVKLIYEKELSGTAGTLIQNLKFFMNEDVLLIHADNYCLEEIKNLIQAHQRRPKNCLMTMMTFRTEDPTSCGIVEVDEHGVVIGFHEKVKFPPGNLANGAVYLLSAELLDKIGSEMNTFKDFSKEVISSLVGKIFIYETTEIFIDIGTEPNYKLANEEKG